MNLKMTKKLCALSALLAFLVSCAPKPDETGAEAEAPTLITGSYQVTNAFVLATYYVENAVALVDMHGFVIRDEEWELPVDSQVLGFMTFDPKTLKGTYELSLPAEPRGEFNDVDNDSDEDAGVQIFSVAYSPNQYGGPFSEGDDRSRGWPSYLASVKTDTENQDEVIGGRLVVWAPDEDQNFPTAFGEDGLLFTQDDPTEPIPAGYSIVDLDQSPFAFVQSPKPELVLYEPSDVALKDYSALSYTEAFDKMFEVVRKEYAFSDIEGKAPDWEALENEIRPRVQKAESQRDANEFYLALRDFTWAFKDGHVNLNGGDYGAQDFQSIASSGYGFAIRELDDGRVVVIYVLEGGPAADADLASLPIVSKSGDILDEGSTVSGRIRQQVVARNAPIVDSDSLGTLEENAAITLTGRSEDGRWLQVMHSGAPRGRGWILASAVDVPGIEVGAEVLGFNGQPISEAIDGAQPYSIQSSDFAIRYQKTRYLLRALPGTEARVKFVNPDASPQTATLTAVAESDSFTRTSLYYGVNTQALLPVEAQLIQQGNAAVGYIRINSNYDDLNLVVRLFERALQKFEAGGVTGIIIDMRYNNGGAPLGLAGFLTDREIALGQLEYFSEATGQFEPEGPRERVRPTANQYRFGKMVLLVGPACFSACEIEAYGFSQVPGMIVAGQYPTAGVEAETARGKFNLPDGFSLTVPTGRFTLEDGSIFLEGQGAPPTLRVPVDEATAASTEDVVLQAGLKAVLEPLGAGITPSGPPQVVEKAGLDSVLSAGTRQLEEFARETYPDDVFGQPGTVSYSVPLTEDTVVWVYGWCAVDSQILSENWENINFDFVLDGEPLALDSMSTIYGEADGKSCRWILAALTDWPPGEHHLSTTATFSAAINDGSTDFPAGEYILDYIVYVRP